MKKMIKKIDSKWSGYNKVKRNNGGIVVSNNSDRNSVYGKVGKKISKSVAMNIMREEAELYNSGRGNFCCSECGKYYELGFGILGKKSSVVFGDDSYACKICVDNMGKGRFVRVS